MSSNVGLSTPRGSGTSGYVQRNLSHLRPRDEGKPYNADDWQRHKQRKPDPEILEHDRKRRIEVQVFELRDRLEDEGKDEDEIEEECEALRRKLTAQDEKNSGRNGGANALQNARGLKAHQVHDLAKAKIEETEKLRRALGIRQDYEEGSHWQRQEERLRNSVPERNEPAESRPVEQERPREGERVKRRESGHRHRERSYSSASSERSSRSRTRSRSPSRDRDGRRPDRRRGGYRDDD